MLSFSSQIIFTDQTLDQDFNHSTTAIQNELLGYVKGLNNIYEYAIFKVAPNERIYFRIGKWVKLKNFATKCNNPETILKEFSEVTNT